MSHNNIFITGVSSGIGLGLSRTFLDRGDRVYGLSRRRPDGLGENFFHVSADLKQLDNIVPKLDELLTGAESLDLAVLNAGILGPIRDMPEQSLDDMRELMTVNVWANKVIMDWLFANCRVNQLITISSGASVNGSRGWGGYSISKAALNMLTRLYAREQPDCHCLALAPGLVDTAMQDDLCGHESDSRFPSLDRIKAARGTDTMPEPDSFATQFIDHLDSFRGYESGSFLDIRDM